MISTKILLFAVCVFSLQHLSNAHGFKQALPHISLRELYEDLQYSKQNENYFNKLKDSGGKFSAFVISEVGEVYSQALQDFQLRAPSCIKSIEKNQIFELPLNEHSNRFTFATITRQFPECFYHGVMSKTFDEVNALITKLLEVVVNKNLKYVANNDIYDLVEAPIKDHIHVYINNITAVVQKEKKKLVHRALKQEHYMVPLHVDNGLYLMITPFKNHGLQIQLSDGKIVSTSDIDSNSIIVLFGRGLTEWLLQHSGKDRKKFYPAPHAVPAFTSNSISYRSVYARMKVAPNKAIPYSNGPLLDDSLESVKTFGEIFMETEPKIKSNKKHINRQHRNSQLCSTQLENSFSPSRNRRKREEEQRITGSWKKQMEDQCKEGEAFCWMNCLPLDEACPSVNESQCIGTDNAPCFDDSMDPFCHWECKPEVSTTIAPTIDPTTQPPQKPFCKSGSFATDMNMKGFFSTGQEEKPCLILFFKAWELDSELKFGFGCVGVIFLGIMVEACIAVRRTITSPSKRGTKIIPNI